MGPLTFVFILATGYLAFWTGHRWRAHTGSRSTYKVAEAAFEKATTARRAALKAVIVACLASVVYLVATGYLTLHGLFGSPADATTPTPTPKPGAQVVAHHVPSVSPPARTTSTH